MGIPHAPLLPTILQPLLLLAPPLFFIQITLSFTTLLIHITPSFTTSLLIRLLNPKQTLDTLYI